MAYGLALVLQPFAGSMAWAIFLAFLLYPLHRWLTRKARGKTSDAVEQHLRTVVEVFGDLGDGAYRWLRRQRHMDMFSVTFTDPRAARVDRCTKVR